MHGNDCDDTVILQMLTVRGQHTIRFPNFNTLIRMCVDIEEDALKDQERSDNVDGDLLAEKQKSLQILGDVLGSTQVKQPKRAKIFK